MKVNIKLLYNDVSIPKFITNGSAGADIYAYIKAPNYSVTIEPKQTVPIGTGFATEFDDNYVALLYPRSGLASKHGIILANSIGVIDSDYRGEWKVLIYNNSNTSYTICHNDRIAQVIFQRIVKPSFCIIDNDLSSSLRSINGLGSTGDK